MIHMPRPTVALALVGCLLVFGATLGCQTTPKSESPPAAQSAGSEQPTDVMAKSDAERATDTLERDRQEMSGERRPHDPNRTRVVDQPRVAPPRR